MPFSDGIWWDEDRHVFCLWYMAGYNGGTAFAQSSDGYHWRKLGLVDPTPRDSSTVWRDDDGSYVRATYFMRSYTTDKGLTLQRSGDGIHWRTVGVTPELGDRSTLFRAHDGRWILSARQSPTAARARRFYVSDTFEGPYALASDYLTAERADDPDALTDPQIYNFDARYLDGQYLGLASIWGGDRITAPKRNNLGVFVSVDGTSWSRGPQQWITEGPQGSWREGNIQTCGGLCIELRPGLLGFYVSARSGQVGPVNRQRCVTGLVTIERKALCL